MKKLVDRRKIFFSIDFEWWYYTTEEIFSTWSAPERLAHNLNNLQESVDGILTLLSETKNTITFFITSDIYEAFPDLVVKIQNHGHEIAWHTHSHQWLKDASILEEELIRSKEFLTTFKPKGFRAPRVLLYYHYIDILVRHGFLYSSSTYGDTLRRSGSFMEIPISTYFFRKQGPTPLEKVYPQQFLSAFFKGGIPFGGALFPSLFSESMMDYFLQKNIKQGKIANLFLHNWQIVQPPSPPLSWMLQRPFLFFYRRTMYGWFKYLCEHYQLVPLDTLI